jgi:DNA polymerase
MSERPAEELRAARAFLSRLVEDGVDWVARKREEETARDGGDASDPEESYERGLLTASSGETLDEVREDLGACTRCRLSEGRMTIVFGEGNPKAKVVFVGEGPGAEEDKSGRPFVGRAGELLTKMIEAMGLRREDVYICNIVKCRPPGNRDPGLDEVAACRPFLDRQLRSIQPRVIVTLGKPASSTLLGRAIAITRARGIWQEWEGIPVMPTYHPAYVLRRYTRETRQAVWEDLKAVLARVEGESDA